MDLVINSIKIKPDIKQVLNLIRRDTNNRYFNIIEDKNSDVLCQCPFNKYGK